MTDPAGDLPRGPRSEVEELREALSSRDKAIAALVRRLETQQSQAIGRLCAGIAHEVSTPTQYVTDNVSFLQRAFDKLTRLIDAQGQLIEAVRNGSPAQPLLENVDGARQLAKLDYLARQVPRAIEQSLEGLGQVSSIVRAMKEFSHPSGGQKQVVDVHDVIESTVIVAKNEWRYVAELELDFDWSLPYVQLLRNEFSQVMLNLIVNAARAIEATLPPGSSEKGKIVISTKAVASNIEVRVKDNGCGIPPAIRPHVFEPLGSGEGAPTDAGRGLATAYSVVVGKHAGSMAFETEAGRGTTFIVTLPLSPS